MPQYGRTISLWPLDMLVGKTGNLSHIVPKARQVILDPLQITCVLSHPELSRASTLNGN